MRLKNSILIFLAGAMMSLLATSCLKNDIPFPVIEAEFLSLTVDGQSAPATIDATNRVVTIHLSEQVDIKRVNITDYKVTEDAVLSGEIMGLIDLSRDCIVTLSIYQDYKWRITADQPIERYFTVEGQVGETVIDEQARRMVVMVPKNMGISAVKIKTLKIGPADVTTMEPDLTGQTVDFTQARRIQVKYHDQEKQWTLYAKTTDVAVDVSRVDAWTNVIWAYGTAQEGKDNGFEYRKAGDEEWTRVPEAWLTVNGGSFSACIRHLAAQTAYEVRGYSDDAYSAVTTVTTEGTQTLPNMDFEDWWLDGKVWCPWAEGGTSTWDTGNKGATTLGDSNSVPTTETCDGKPGRAALLQTKFVGIAAVGKLAAGNLFTGRYVKTDGTNGILSFGRPFTGRPTRLRGFMKYTTSTIAYSNTDHAYLKGQPDTAVVYIALADWAQPYEIRTNPKNQQLFSPNLPGIIAYGEMKWGQNVDNFTEFDIPLKYNATNKVPTHILIVCTASKYGDFFTGGASSTLVVDNFALEWDYE